MKQIMKKVSAVILLLAFAMAVTAGAAAASEADPGYVPLMEINDENLISIAEELKPSLQTIQQHLDLYSVSPEIMELGQAADDLFTGSAAETHVFTVDPVEILNVLATPAEIEEIGIDTELMNALQLRIGNTLINSMIAKIGVDYIAFSSLMVVSRSFVADLDHEILVVQEYDGEFSLVAEFVPSGEHVMTAVEMTIPSETVPELLEILS